MSHPFRPRHRGAPRPPRAWPCRGLVAALLCAGLTAGSGCDPCSGVAACHVAPRVGISGQIVEAHGTTSSPRRGVQVQVTRTGGIATTPATATATTDGTGWWRVSLAATETGTITADVTVTAGGDAPPYQVSGLVFQATDGHGDGAVVGRWTHRGFLTALGEVFDAKSGARLGGVRVTATRVAGASVAPTAGTQSPMVSEGGTGRFLFALALTTSGPVVFDFTFERDGYRPVVVRGVALNPQYEWLPPNVNGNLIFHLTFVPA